MDGIIYLGFLEWATNHHDWLEMLTHNEEGMTHHYFLTPTGRMVHVLEGDDKVVAMYEMRVVEPEE